MKQTVRTRFRQTAAAAVAMLLVLSVFGPVGTVAAQEVSVTQSTTATTAAPGETVTLTTTFTSTDVNGPLLQADLPENWQGTITDADGGSPKPPSGTANVLEVVWLSTGSYEVTYEVTVPEDAAPGDYTVDVTGSGVDPADGSFVEETAQTTITVAEPEQNDPPTASFTSSPTDPETDEQVSFDASASTDADGSIASYEWDFGDGTTATGEAPTHTYDAAGDYQVELTVTDDDGASATTTQTVSVSAPPTNQDPSAAASYSPQSPTAGEQVSFDASASTDADGSIASYEWDFGDGTTATGETPTHTYDSSGTYTVTLTVTDDDGATSTDTVSVTVEESATGNVVFAVNAGGDGYVADDGTTYVADTNFDGGNDYAISSDTDIENTDDDPLYRTERWGDFSYDVPVENGEYEVTLQFAEIYQGVSEEDTVDDAGPDDGTNENDAVFDVAIEGQEVITGYDLFAELGPLNATERTYTVTVTDGELNLDFVTDTNYAKVSAITVESVGGGGANTPPSVDAGADQTVSEGDAVELSASASDPDGDSVSYSWVQTGGPGVSLTDADTATPTFTAPDVDDETTLTFQVTAADGNGGTATDTVSVTVQNAAAGDLTTAVSLTPSDQAVDVNGEATFDVVVENADGGVGAYTLTVSVANPSTAHITDVTLANANGATTDVSISDDDSSVTVDAALVDTAQDGPVSLLSVTVVRDEQGTTPVTLDVETLGSESGDAYTVTATEDATLSVSSLVVGPSENPAQDPDGDGVYEDVNGDGTVDVLDVQTLFAARESGVVTSNPDAFDFNGDGTFDLLDVQALYYDVAT